MDDSAADCSLDASGLCFAMALKVGWKTERHIDLSEQRSMAQRVGSGLTVREVGKVGAIRLKFGVQFVWEITILTLTKPTRANGK